VLPAIGLLTLELRLEGSHSLKQKRQVVRALKARLRQRFNVSVAETDHQDSWQRARIDIAVVSGDRTALETQIRTIETDAEEFLGGDLADSRVELF